LTASFHLAPGRLVACARPWHELVGGDDQGDENDQPDADANAAAPPAVDAWRWRRAAQLWLQVVIGSARPLVHLRSFNCKGPKYMVADRPRLMNIR